MVDVAAPATPLHPEHAVNRQSSPPDTPPTSQPLYTARLAGLQASPIREILAVIDRPGMVSFAGGLPADPTFPELSLETVPRQCLQYGPSEGEMPLRRRIAQELSELGLRCEPEQVLVLSGSQQGIDLVAKLFIDPGTPVAVESPTYLAALQVFRFQLAHFVPLNDDWSHLPGGRPALAYVIPTFQNPTGHCFSVVERQSIAERCAKHDAVLFEDDPYRDLVYDDCDRQPACGYMPEGSSWIYQGSFSKTLAPGLRLGFLVASPNLIPYLTRLKQAADLHSNRLSQLLVLRMLEDSGRAQRMQQLQEYYRHKRDVFESRLRATFGELAEWRTPQGGLFFWLRLKRRVDTRQLLPRAIERSVAFMPGEPFYFDPEQGVGTLRLNFSHASEEQMERGLETLAKLVEG